MWADKDALGLPNTCVHDIKQRHQARAIQRVREIINAQRILKRPYKDPDFPPGPECLGELVWDPRVSEVEFVRFADLPGSGGWEIVRDGYDPCHIRQGRLGNCWFLAALAVLSDNLPELLDDVMVSKDVNSKGVYLVRFCKDGSWTTVIIDDFFATHLGSTARHAQLWVSLIEKAYAKLHGSYAALEGGDSADALRDLTGAPCESIDFREADFDSEQTFLVVMNGHESGWPMTCHVGVSIAERAAYERIGLAQGHAYSLLAVDEDLLILNIRNPWGLKGQETKWKGDWSEDSPLWTPAIRKRLRSRGESHGGNKGAFWMSWEDFILYFSGVTICKYYRNAHCVSAESTLWSNTFCSKSMYTITASVPTPLHLMMFQKDGRRPGSRSTDLSLLCVETSQTDPTNITEFKPVGCIWPTRAATATVQMYLGNTKASYLVIPYHLSADEEIDFTLVAYSRESVQLKVLPSHENYLTAAALLTVTAGPSPKNTHTLRPGIKLKEFNYRTGSGDYSTWFLVENTSGKAIIVKVRLKVQNMTSIRGSYDEDAIEPMARRLLNVLVKPKSEAGSYSYTYTHRAPHTFTGFSSTPPIRSALFGCGKISSLTMFGPGFENM